MEKNKEKFASQANAEVLAAMRKVAEDEGRQFQSVLDEAMRDFLDKKHGNKPRAHVLSALNESISEFNSLYKDLAK